MVFISWMMERHVSGINLGENRECLNQPIDILIVRLSKYRLCVIGYYDT